MNPEQPDRPIPEDAFAQLERCFIADFLRSRGHDAETLHELPEEQVRHLLAEASLYASAKLVEVDARAHWVTDMHGGAPHV